MDLFPYQFQFTTGPLTFPLRPVTIILANLYWVPSVMQGWHSARHLPNTNQFNSPNHPVREAFLLLPFYIWKKLTQWEGYLFSNWQTPLPTILDKERDFKRRNFFLSFLTPYRCLTSKLNRHFLNGDSISSHHVLLKILNKHQNPYEELVSWPKDCCHAAAYTSISSCLSLKKEESVRRILSGTLLHLCAYTSCISVWPPKDGW